MVSQSIETEAQLREQLSAETSRREKIESEVAQLRDEHLRELDMLRADVLSKEHAREEAVADSQAARSELESLRCHLKELGDIVLST